MMKPALACIAAAALSGCMDIEAARAVNQACLDAVSYADRYGTPERRGPCWVETLSQGATAGIRTYTVSGQRGTTTLAYRGNEIVSVVEVARIRR
jgi:hypothetical protein